MKRFCIFSANFIPNLGGIERYTLNLGKELVRMGNQVTVVTSNVFHLANKEQVENLQVYRIPCFNVLNGRFPVVKPNREFWDLNGELNRQEFDFVIVQARFYVHSLYAVSFAKKRGIPCIVIEHGTNHFTVNQPVWDFLGHIYEHIITGLVKRKCDSFYGVSKDCCKWSGHFGIQSKGTLYNAVDLAEIELLKTHPVEDYRKKYALEDTFVVTYTGRLIREKGILKLISAVQCLRNEGRSVTLMVAGDGGEFENLKKQDLPGVHFLGKIDFPHVVALLRTTDIFCLPSDYSEGFPTSVLEAAACGCYVVTTSLGGAKELILDESYGRILANNAPEAIAEAIRRGMDDPRYRERAAEKARQYLSEHFTWEATAQRVLELCGDASEGSRMGRTRGKE